MDFFEDWFKGFGDGLDNLSTEERGRLFKPCASFCARDSFKHLYHDLFIECEGNLDQFFGRLGEVEGVDGKVVEAGKNYELFFLSCTCDLHTRSHVNTPNLCECSRQSILFLMRALLPGQEFKVEEQTTILKGDSHCCFKVSKKG